VAKGKTVAQSKMTTVRLMMPTDANILGNVFGGAIMRYMDEVAGVVAFHHARKIVVTAAIDRMSFFAPVYVGNLLILKSAVNHVGKTSMEVGVRIEAEDLLTGKVTHTGSCYLTYVALNQGGRPTTIAPVIPVTKQEKRRHREAQARKRQRDRERRTEGRDP